MLCEAAVRAGYPLFQHSLSDGSYIRLNVSIAALTWSRYEIYKRVIERDMPTVILHDDVKPVCGYDDLVGLVDWLDSYDKDWKFVNLSMYNSKRPDLVALREDMVEHKVGGAGSIEVAGGMYSLIDNAGLVSPAGARWLLEEMYPSSFINMDHEMFDVDAWAECCNYSLWCNPELFFLYLGFFKDASRFVGGLYTVFDSCFKMSLPLSYIGSYIYDVDLLIEKGEWVCLY